MKVRTRRPEGTPTTDLVRMQVPRLITRLGPGGIHVDIVHVDVVQPEVEDVRRLREELAETIA